MDTKAQSENVGKVVSRESAAWIFLFFAACVLAIQIYLSLGGTLRLFQSRPLNKAYDVLSMNLLEGNAEVGEAIRHEVIEYDGRPYMYFGPLPAIARIVPNLLFPQFFGKWSYLSFVLAAFIFLYYYTRLTLLCVQESSDTSLSKLYGGNVLIGLLGLVGFCLGFELFFLYGRSIYNEASIWGLAPTIAALYYAFRVCKLQDSRLRTLFFLGAFSGAALLSRITFGVSSGLLCGVALFFLLRDWHESNRCSSFTGHTPYALKVLALCVPALLCVAIQLWYNIARFDSAFAFVDIDGYLLSERRVRNFKAVTEHGYLALERIPRALEYYFLPVDLPGKDSFPYFNPRRVTPHPLFTRLGATVIPLTLCSAPLLLGAACGLFQAIRKRGESFVWLFAVACLPQFFLMLSYNGIRQRYALDLLPLFFVFFFFWLWHPFERHRIGTPLLIGCFALSVALSISFNMTRPR